MDNDGFCHCYDIFFRKLHTECYLIKAVQNSFSTITRHVDTSILKDVLQLNIGHGSAYVLNLSLRI